MAVSLIKSTPYYSNANEINVSHVVGKTLDIDVDLYNQSTSSSSNTISAFGLLFLDSNRTPINIKLDGTTSTTINPIDGTNDVYYNAIVIDGYKDLSYTGRDTTNIKVDVPTDATYLVWWNIKSIGKYVTADTNGPTRIERSSLFKNDKLLFTVDGYNNFNGIYATKTHGFGSYSINSNEQFQSFDLSDNPSSSAHPVITTSSVSGWSIDYAQTIDFFTVGTGPIVEFTTNVNVVMYPPMAIVTDNAFNSRHIPVNYLVSMDASNSIDSDGDTLTYLWSVVSDDGYNITLSSTTDAVVTFTVPDTITPGTSASFVFQVEVSDGVYTDIEQVSFTVIGPYDPNKDYCPGGCS